MGTLERKRAPGEAFDEASACILRQLVVEHDSTWCKHQRQDRQEQGSVNRPTSARSRVQHLENTLGTAMKPRDPCWRFVVMAAILTGCRFNPPAASIPVFVKFPHLISHQSDE